MPPTIPENIRNIGIIAHIDAGKTTLTERMLFYCQKIHRIGEVHDGAATMDFLPEEQERGITITAACTTCFWQDKQINLIDTPGHVDFTVEVERCLAVLDGTVGVFCAVAGVEPQSETVWRQAAKFNIPALAFINKMDRQGANFEKAVQSLRDRLDANAVPMTIPVGEGDAFAGIMDVLKLEKLIFSDTDQGRTVTRTALQGEELKRATLARDYMLEKLAETDDDFLALWLEGSFTEEEMLKALKRATVNRKIVPVYCGTALRNAGIQPLLDGVCDFLPEPTPYSQKKVMYKGKIGAKDAPLGLIFKILVENGRKNCFLRLYNGSIREGDFLVNARTGKAERIGRLSRIHAERREPLSELKCGDIGIITGIRDGKTGDTLRDKTSDILLEPIRVQAPVITISLEPRNADEGKILDEALARYAEEDPTLRIELDEETGSRMLSGMGELHLEVILERLTREYKIKPRTGMPQAVSRETPTRSATADVVFDKELGKERHQGEVAVTITPVERGTGVFVQMGAFLPENTQEARKLLPDFFIEAVKEGINGALQTGVSGWPVTDCQVTIEKVIKTDNLTTVPGLRMAASLAVRDALMQAGCVALEPIMEVEISCPDDYLGGALNIFGQCLGKVENLEDEGDFKRITGLAPLRELFGFSTKIRSATQGRAGFSMSFKKFDRM